MQYRARLAILRIAQRTSPGDGGLGAKPHTQQADARDEPGAAGRVEEPPEGPSQQPVLPAGGDGEEGKHEGGGGEADREQHGGMRRGVGGKLRAVGGWVLRTAISWVAPGNSGLQEVERQVGVCLVCAMPPGCWQDMGFMEGDCAFAHA